MVCTTLISASELAEALRASPPPVVLDASFDLAEPTAGEREHQAGHIPGAVYVHLERDLSGAKNGPDGRFRGRHPLPDPTVLACALGGWGITPATQVVVVDRQGGMVAARAWWLLRWLGHQSVAVLDGGMAAWAAAGGALESSAPAPVAAAPYPHGDMALAMAELTVDAAALRAGLGRLRLLDARAPERFRGDTEPLDPVAGHIPGARNRFFKDNLIGGRFKPADQLRAEFAELLAGQPASSLVQQCGSGVTACHNILAMEVAGLPGSRLYPGSWSEWSSDPARPVARA